MQDVQDAFIMLQEDLLKDSPDGYWTMGADGIKVLRYTDQDKLNLTAEPRIEFKVMIMEPIESRRIQIFAPTDKVNEMVKLVESMGLKLKVKPATSQ